jgi:hypothetical protein
MSDFHLQQVWHEACLELTRCERVIFCGYSLPDADIHIKYLLKRAEVNAGRTPDVFVVNNHPGKEERLREEERARYRRAFRDSSKVQYTELSFAEFANGQGPW